MMDHIYKVARPQDFAQWTEAVRQYHQDNTAVQNIRGIYEDTQRKQSLQKKGFSAQQLAKILGVKMPSLDPNTMELEQIGPDPSTRTAGLRDAQPTLRLMLPGPAEGRTMLHLQ
jgi:hypothetical protein